MLEAAAAAAPNDRVIVVVVVVGWGVCPQTPRAAAIIVNILPCWLCTRFWARKKNAQTKLPSAFALFFADGFSHSQDSDTASSSCASSQLTRRIKFSNQRARLKRCFLGQDQDSNGSRIGLGNQTHRLLTREVLQSSTRGIRGWERLSDVFSLRPHATCAPTEFFSPPRHW